MVQIKAYKFVRSERKAAYYKEVVGVTVTLRGLNGCYQLLCSSKILN